MDFTINTTDFTEHLHSLHQKPVAAKEGLQHQRLGSISIGAHPMPGMQAVELVWQLPANRVVLTDKAGGNGAINISFQLKGSMFTRFAGIRHPLDMKAGSHNLVYLSESGDTHTMEAGQDLSVFQLTMDKHYFMQCLESEDSWSDAMLKKLEKNNPFAAAEKSAVITPRMQYLLQSIQTDTKQGPMKKLLLQSRLLELVALQVEQYSNQYKKEAAGPSAGDRQKLFELRAYLDTHFLADLSLMQLSRVSCLNEFKLKKGFKSCFGETVFGYIRKLRMNHAAKLLQDTAQTVDEVAASLGYEHAHHFSKAFKEFTGCVPTAYRRGSLRCAAA